MIRKVKLITLFLLLLSLHLCAQNNSDHRKKIVLDSVISKIEKVYPFQEISLKTINGLNEQINSGYFDKTETLNEFACKVTESLEELSKDKHLDLIYNPELAKILLADNSEADVNYTIEEAKTELWNNYGFKELSILDGNIGYINLSVFFATEYAGKKADIAMNFFSDCNALIIDLRQNGGGWGDMVDYLLGYFIDYPSPLLLTITESNLDGSKYSEVVPQYVPGEKLTDIPIYLLTSPVTASAAESFTSHMKYFNKNVTIIGKRTKGAENPVLHIALNEDFILQIPGFKILYSANPIGWEGVGINPDIDVPVKDAKRTAHLMALENLINSSQDNNAIYKYQWAIDGLKAGYDIVSVKNIIKYSGKYDKIKVNYIDGKLYYQYAERPENLLIPISDDYFLVEGIDYFRVKFFSDKESVVMKLIYTYGYVKEIVRD